MRQSLHKLLRKILQLALYRKHRIYIVIRTAQLLEARDEGLDEARSVESLVLRQGKLGAADNSNRHSVTVLVITINQPPQYDLDGFIGRCSEQNLLVGKLLHSLQQQLSDSGGLASARRANQMKHAPRCGMCQRLHYFGLNGI